MVGCISLVLWSIGGIGMGEPSCGSSVVSLRGSFLSSSWFCRCWWRAVFSLSYAVIACRRRSCVLNRAWWWVAIFRMICFLVGGNGVCLRVLRCWVIALHLASIWREIAIVLWKGLFAESFSDIAVVSVAS